MSDDAPVARPAARRVVVAVAVVALLAVVFAIGRFTAFGASAAPATPSTVSADAGFARDMQVHHTQAVLMAMEIYRKTSDDELRTLSYDIATTQAGQRGEMFGWLVQWGLPQASSQPLMQWMVASSAHSHGDTSALPQDELLAQMGMASDAELDELRTLSYDIATTQAGQRGEMFGWLVQWGLPQASSQPLMQWMAPSSAHSHGDTSALSEDDLLSQMGMATDAELDQLRSLEGQPADCLFLGLMIRHHEGAIPMAEAVVELGSDPRVKDVAQTIITGQSAEIDAMRDIQTRLSCTG